MNFNLKSITVIQWNNDKHNLCITVPLFLTYLRFRQKITNRYIPKLIFTIWKKTAIHRKGNIRKRISTNMHQRWCNMRSFVVRMDAFTLFWVSAPTCQCPRFVWTQKERLIVGWGTGIMSGVVLWWLCNAADFEFFEFFACVMFVRKEPFLNKGGSLYVLNLYSRHI